MYPKTVSEHHTEFEKQERTPSCDDLMRSAFSKMAMATLWTIQCQRAHFFYLKKYLDYYNLITRQHIFFDRGFISMISKQDNTKYRYQNAIYLPEGNKNDTFDDQKFQHRLVRATQYQNQPPIKRVNTQENIKNTIQYT
jgi:hypothetical protein